MANRGSMNSGYGPGEAPPYRNEQSELEIGFWDPSKTAVYSNSSEAPQTSAVQWQDATAGGYQQNSTNPHLYAQGDINSDWRAGPVNAPPVAAQQSPYYGPTTPSNYIPQPGYIGEMLIPASNITYPQYQTAGNPGVRQTVQDCTQPPPQNFFQQPPLISVAQQQPQANMGRGTVHGSPHSQIDHWSSEPQALVNNNPPNSSFSSPQSFRNPLMSNESSNVNDAESLIRNMRIEGQKAQQQMQNYTSYPTVISKASLAMLKSDLDQAAVPFESPEALKLARERQLGLHSVEDVGRTVFVSGLSANAVNFIPRAKSAVQEYVPSQASKEEEELVIGNLKSFIEKIVIQPGTFDEHSVALIGQVKRFLYSDDVVKDMVEIIFEKAIGEDNFKYLGARLCDKLTQPKVLPNFRSIFLNHFQSEFKTIRPLVVENKEESREKVHGFLMFMAEIFIHIKINDKPLIAFGRSLNKFLEKLLATSTATNVTFVCKVLKLTGAKLLDAFEGNEADTENYGNNFTILNAYAEQHKDKTDEGNKRIALLISSVSRLKNTNWGRTMSNTRTKSAIDDPEQYGDDLSEVDQNYYMNEPVFFTPDGIQYTAAEAQIPEFYEQHLAKHNLKPDVSNDDTSSFPWSQSDDALDEYVPSDEEEDLYKQQSEDAEYGCEFEKFLAETGQLP